MGVKAKYALVVCIVCGLSYSAIANLCRDNTRDGATEPHIAALHKDASSSKNNGQLVKNVGLVKSTVERGDFNQDGTVDSWDLAILTHFTKQPLGFCPECDLNNDHEITADDAKTLISLCTFSGCKSSKDEHISRNT